MIRTGQDSVSFICVCGPWSNQKQAKSWVRHGRCCLFMLACNFAVNLTLWSFRILSQQDGRQLSKQIVFDGLTIVTPAPSPAEFSVSAERSVDSGEKAVLQLCHCSL